MKCITNRESRSLEGSCQQSSSSYAFSVVISLGDRRIGIKQFVTRMFEESKREKYTEQLERYRDMYNAIFEIV